MYKYKINNAQKWKKVEEENKCKKMKNKDRNGSAKSKFGQKTQLNVQNVKM